MLGTDGGAGGGLGSVIVRVFNSRRWFGQTVNPLVPKHRMHYQKTFIFHPGSSFGESNRKQGLNLY